MTDEGDVRISYVGGGFSKKLNRGEYFDMGLGGEFKITIARPRPPDKDNKIIKLR